MKDKIYNILSFIGYSLREKMVLLSILGYILIIISPWFSWYSSALSYTGVSEETKLSMFGLAGELVKDKSYIALGIFTMLVGFGLLIIEYKDYRMKLRSRLAATLAIEIILYIVLIIMVIAAMNNEALREIMSYRQGEIKALEYWIDEATGHCNRGVGPVLYISGLALAIFSKVGAYIFYFIDYVKDSLTIKKRGINDDL